jgi:O-antigen/teichoic acid export membrane protein
VKFSQHIGKGVWGLAGRGLPMVHAVALILLVVNALPRTEFGGYNVFQSVYILLFMFSDNFALQAIVKYGVEPDVDLTELLSTTFTIYAAFLLSAIIPLIIWPTFWGRLLNSPTLPDLMPWMAAFIVVTIPRAFISKILQMRFHVKEIFFVDLANFGLSAIILTAFVILGKIHTAEDVIRVTVFCGLLSSLVALWLGRKDIFVQPRFSRNMTKRIVEFGKYQSGTGLASSLMNSLDALMVSKFTGAVGVAVYGSAKNLYRLFDVFRDTQTMFVFPASSKYYSRGEFGTLRTIIEKAISFLYLIMVPLAILLIVLAPQIFQVLYRGKYNEAVPVFQILMCAALILPIQMVLSTSMVGFGKMKQFFRVMIVSFVINIIAAFALLLTTGVNGAAIAFVIGLAAQAFQFFFIVKQEVGFETRELFFRGWRDALAYAKRRSSKAPEGV